MCFNPGKTPAARIQFCEKTQQWGLWTEPGHHRESSPELRNRMVFRFCITHLTTTAIRIHQLSLHGIAFLAVLDYTQVEYQIGWHKAARSRNELYRATGDPANVRINDIDPLMINYN